jgi:hypothetical protein
MAAHALVVSIAMVTVITIETTLGLNDSDEQSGVIDAGIRNVSLTLSQTRP